MWVSSEKTDSDSKTESVFKVKEWMKLLWVWMQDLQFVEENYLFVMSLKPTDFFPTTEPFIFLTCLFLRCETAQKLLFLFFQPGQTKRKFRRKKNIFSPDVKLSEKKKKKSVFKGNKKHFFQKKKKSWENVFCIKIKKIRRKTISHERSSKTFFLQEKTWKNVQVKLSEIWLR